MPRSPTQQLAAPLITGLLFSGSFVAGEYTTVDLPPLTTIALRYGIALLALIAVAIGGRRRTWRIRPADALGFAGLGLTGIIGYHYFFLIALQHTAVANTAIMNALSPTVTAILAALLIRERLQGRHIVGLLAATTGVLVLVGGGTPGGGLNRGDGLMFLAVISWALYALGIKRMSERYDGFTLTFYATIAGVVLLIPGLPWEQPVAALAAASRRSLLAVVYMGVATSGIGYLLYNRSIAAIGPTRTATVVYSIVPLCVAGLAWLFFREPVTWRTGVSAALIIAGVHLTVGAGVTQPPAESARA